MIQTLETTSWARTLPANGRHTVPRDAATGMASTVLLIEDDADDALLITRAITAADPLFRIESAARLSGGIRRLEEGGIDVIVLDLTLPDCTGATSFRRLHEAVPDVPIVVLTGLESQDLALRLMQEGAQDYITKGDTDGAGLARALRYAIRRHGARQPQANEPKPRGHVIGFIGAKGGVGTSTVALNVAASLAQGKTNVAGIELSRSGSAFAAQLGLGNVENTNDLSALEAEHITERALSPRLCPAVFGSFLPAHARGEDRGMSAAQTEAAIVAAANLAEYVVVDLTADNGPVTEAAVRRCDLLTVVLEREPLCVRAAQSVLALLRAWGVPPNRMAAVVVNRAALSAPLPLETIASQLCCHIAGIVPPAADECILAATRGVPLVASDPDGLAPRVLGEITNKLAEGVRAARRLSAS